MCVDPTHCADCSSLFPPSCFQRICLLMFRFCRLRLRDLDTLPTVGLIDSVATLSLCVFCTASPPFCFCMFCFFDQMCARTIRSSQIDKAVPVVITEIKTAPTRSCPKIGMPASWKIVPGAVGYAKVGSCMTRGIYLSCTPLPSPHPLPRSHAGPSLLLTCGSLRLILCCGVPACISSTL